MDGIINVLKPPGMTSHDVDGFLRRLFKIKRIGHTGTLDPDAVGVLPICVGKATKVVEYLTDKRKKYRAEMVLGITTDTQDSSGEVLEERPVNVTEEQIMHTVKSFIGKIKQIPPMYSAIKVDGKKLYELARQGIEVERKQREIEIYNIDIININLENNKIMFDVECSKGTYVRTLCVDIGESLGCGGHMSFLVRTATQPFEIQESFTLDEISEQHNDGKTGFIMPIDSLFLHLPILTVKEESMKWVLNGGEIYKKDVDFKDNIENSLVRVYDKDERFLAIYRAGNRDGKLVFSVDTMFV